MSIIYQKDKRSGITYAYESVSYWDKEKKQPRSKRRLIGRLDEATGQVVPTDGRMRKTKTPPVPKEKPELPDNDSRALYEMELKTREALARQARPLEARLSELTSDNTKP